MNVQKETWLWRFNAWGLLSLWALLLCQPSLGQCDHWRTSEVEPTPSTQEVVVDTALSYAGTTETPAGSNWGEPVETFLSSVGIGRPAPWCAAAVHYFLAAGGASSPDVTSGLALHYATKAADSLVTDARRVLRGTNPQPLASLVVFRRGDTWKGHIGIARRPWTGACGKTIEANTSPGEAGSQRDGDGVWRKRPCIQPGNYFRITHFVRVF